MESVIIAASSGGFDYAFYERLKQEALLVPTNFHFDLGERVMKKRQASSIELMLADLLLRMARYEDSWQARAYEAGRAVAGGYRLADADLKATTIFNLAKFALEKRNDLKEILPCFRRWNSADRVIADCGSGGSGGSS